MKHSLTWILAALLALPGRPARAEPANRKLLVEVPDSSVCPSGTAVVEKLRGELPSWQVALGVVGKEGLGVVVKPSVPGTLTLQLLESGRVVEQRPLSFTPSNCGDLGQTIALIVRIWVRALPGLPLRVTEPAPRRPLPLPPETAHPSHPPDSAVVAPPPPVEAPLPQPTPGARRLPTQTEPPTVATPPAAKPDPAPPLYPEPVAATRSESAALEVAPVDAGTPPVAPTLVAEVSVPPVLPSEPPPQTRAPVPAPSAPPAPLAFHLELLAEGGVLAATTGPLAPSAGLRIDLGLGDRFGLQLAGSWDASVTESLGPGSVTISRLTFGLDLRATFYPRSSTASRIVLLLGPALQRLDGSGKDFTSTSSKVAVGAGMEVGAIWMESIPAGFSFWAGPVGRLWFSQDSFVVAGLSKGASAPAGWLGADFGLAYRWD